MDPRDELPTTVVGFGAAMTARPTFAFVRLVSVRKLGRSPQDTRAESRRNMLLSERSIVIQNPLKGDTKRTVVERVSEKHTPLA